MKRDYGQHCAVAKALDVVGGRWTLLIIRELLPGPRRFKDLQAGIPGIGTNLLADRLRQLEEEEAVEKRTLPPPAGSTVYELTDLGRELEAVIVALSRWGWHKLETPNPDDAFHPRWMLMAMRTGYVPEAAAGVQETYEFRIGDEVFHVKVDDGEVDAFDGPAPDPDLVVTADVDSLLAAGQSRDALREALAEGRIRSEGDPAVQQHCMAIFAPVFSSGRAYAAA